MAALIWIDYAIIGLFVILTVFGLKRGFAAEAFAFIVWCAALGIALNFSRELAVYLEPWSGNLTSRVALALASLCMITLMVGKLIAFLLGDTLKITGLCPFSRFFGMLVGSSRTVMVVTFLAILAGVTSLPAESWWKEAQLVFPFQKFAIWLRNNVSSGVTEFINYE